MLFGARFVFVEINAPLMHGFENMQLKLVRVKCMENVFFFMVLIDDGVCVCVHLMLTLWLWFIFYDACLPINRMQIALAVCVCAVCAGKIYNLNSSKWTTESFCSHSFRNTMSNDVKCIINSFYI